MLGQQLGPYQIEAILGSGGMAVVYRAKNGAGQPVALKVLFPPPGAGPEILARFEREARTAARLRHPGIVRVLDTGQSGGYAFMVMSLVEGPTLAERLAQVGALAETGAADIAWQIADALDYAHGQGVVHRDVKPSNILLTETGRALLTDFGVAQALDDLTLTRTGYTVGTPAYMAPEQTSGEPPVDGRADLYALGVVVYQMVTGRTPFRGSTPQVLHAHVYEPPPRPSTIAPVSTALEGIILKALAKDVAQRFQTGAAMAQALANLEDQTAALPVEPVVAVKPRRRWPWLVTIGALLALIVLYGSWGLFSPIVATTPTPAALLASATRPANPPTPPSLTSTSTATPTPSPSASPTQTPGPTLPATPTPLPPTPTALPQPIATLPPPTPTETVTSTPCPLPITTTLSIFLGDNPPRTPLGCPRTEAISVAAARQTFENGLLLWRKDANFIYGLQPDQSWFFTADTWRDGDPSDDPSIIPPNGLYQPVRGFGKVWRERPNVRDSLGWGAGEEVGFSAILQEFSSGLVWWDIDRSTGLILFNDGFYQTTS